MAGQDIILLVAGVLLPIAFAIHVFLNNRWIYPVWAKPAVVILCSVAVVWGSLDWVVLNWRSFYLTREAYDRLIGIRALLGGVCLGIALSISLARPYRKNVDKTEQAQSPSD